MTSTTFSLEERPSDSPLVDSVWRTDSGGVDTFLSIAATHCGLVVTRQYGQTTVTLRGPETKVTIIACPPEAEFFGVQFKLGVFMPTMPASELVDAAIHLPVATGRSFWLDGAAWEYPTFENADVFIAKLVHEGILQCDPMVAATADGAPASLSPRTVQRRFVQATGLTQDVIRQIERARQATALLRAGTPIPDVVARTGYADQSHLTRALQRFIGQTPSRLLRDPLPTSRL